MNKQQSNEPQNQQTPQRFFKLLEAGDLAFLDFMAYAIIIFGITKHGKTTYAHHLAGHALEPYKNHDGDVHYQLVTETLKRSDARIGNKSQSETQIPNKFETKIMQGNQPVYLIDNPGQKDSFGINRILSNAYFHYRVFSKIQNMKIVLLFDYPIFGKNVKQTNTIMNLFLSCFTDFENVKDKLINSIGFVFTKVGSDITFEDVISRMKEYKSMVQKNIYFEKEKIDFIVQLIEQCVEHDERIKIFRKAELGVNLEVNPNLIKEISSSLQYFQRELQVNDDFQSKYYKETRVSMENIKFSETNRIKSLGNEKFSMENSLKLFSELTRRGELLFSAFFRTLSEMFSYVVFDGQESQFGSGKKLNSTEAMKETRKKAQREILDNLAQVTFEYDESQKYTKRRQGILMRYAKSFKSTEKADNFIERMLLATSFQGFCQKYLNPQIFQNKNKTTINNCRRDFQQIIEKLSRFYSSKEEIDILARFHYDLNTLFNQMIIFTLIILPFEEETGKAKEVDPFLGNFLRCLVSMSSKASDMNTVLVKGFTEKLKIKNLAKTCLEDNVIMDHFLRRFPNIILQQTNQEQKVLKSLLSIPLPLNQKLHCSILTFNYLQKQFYLLTELKTLQESSQAIDLSASTVSTSLSEDSRKTKKQKNQNSSNQVAKNDIVKLIKSFVAYLKTVKKMKELVQYNDLKAYKNQIYEINLLTWTYLTKLFSLLLDSTQLQQSQKQDVTELLVQIVSNSKNYSLIEEVFDKIILKYQEAFNELTLKTLGRTLDSEKRIKHPAENIKIYLASKKELSSQIIILATTYAGLLNGLGLKEKALAQCYSAIKYTEFSPSQIFNIEEAIRDIKSKNTGFRFEDNFGSITEFQATITIKKKLAAFLKENADVKEIQCVKYDFLR